MALFGSGQFGLARLVSYFAALVHSVESDLLLLLRLPFAPTIIVDFLTHHWRLDAGESNSAAPNS